MSSPITIERIKKLIKNAEEAHVPEQEINNLREYLEEMQSPDFHHQPSPEPTIKEFEVNGKTVTIYSPYPSDRDDFEGVEF